MDDIFVKLDDKLRKDNFSGNVCVMKDKQIIFEHSYGYAEYDNRISNTFDTCFSIASITKQFTAVAILQLQEAKKLDLDQTIESFFPDYAPANLIRVRNLLNMSSGIPDYLNDVIDATYREQEKQSNLSEEDFFFYATDGMNRNYTYKDVMRLISGLPLQMNETHWNAMDTDANSYVIYNGCRKELGRSRCQGADGGLVSTVHDLCQWILETSNHTVLSHKGWEECFHVVVNQDSDSCPSNYGFGWIKLGDWILHGGSQLGYCSGVAINQKLGYSVIILSNCYNHDSYSDPLIDITHSICVSKEHIE